MKDCLAVQACQFRLDSKRVRQRVASIEPAQVMVQLGKFTSASQRLCGLVETLLDATHKANKERDTDAAPHL